MFDVLARITELRVERGWSSYKLSRETGIPQSTIATWKKKNLMPPVDKIEIICDAFGITLQEFFSFGEVTELTNQQAEMLDKFTRLTPKQRKAVLSIIELLFSEE